MDAADQAERRGQRDHEVSRQDRRQVARRAGNRRAAQIKGPCVAHRPHEAARRHRRAGHVSGRRAAQGRRLDARHLPQGGGGLPQGRLPVRHRARHDGRFSRHLRRHLPRASAPMLVERQGRHHGQERQRASKALEYWKRLVAYLPPDAPAWDDATNNKWFVAGKTALIMNPPSAWAVAQTRQLPRLPSRLWSHGVSCRSRRADLREYVPLLLGCLELQQEPERQPRASLFILSQKDRSLENMVESQQRLRPAVLRQLHGLSRPGRRRDRPRARSITTPTSTITRSCRLPPHPRPTRSPFRSIGRGFRPRWWCATPSRASRWTRCWRSR